MKRSARARSGEGRCWRAYVGAVVVCAVAFFGAPPASGAEQEPPALRRVAILSLIGDEISLVVRTPHLTGNRTDRVQIPGSALDNYALLVLHDALSKTRSGLPIDLLEVNDPALYAAQDGLLDEQGSDARTVRDAMGKQLADVGASHLLLLTKHRGPARLRLTFGSVGEGQLRGLGFYLDHTLRVRRSDTSEVGRGLLAVFAYVRLSLVDARSLRVIRSDVEVASSTFSAARNESGLDPWEALSPQQKVEELKRLLRKELLQMLPKVLH